MLVIGAGPVGENLADYATQGGLSVALIEHELLGGGVLLLRLYAFKGPAAALAGSYNRRHRPATR